ncbi:MAG: hypothetical protein WC876_10615 [Candidatus Thermoplasmatota archaeon]|jgi:hypothetical protein
MGYPPAIPPLKPKEGREFLKRANGFSLNKDQKEFWSDASKTIVSSKRKA